MELDLIHVSPVKQTIVSPWFSYLFIWGGVYFLYYLKYSELLIYSGCDALYVLALVVFPFFVGYFFNFFLYKNNGNKVYIETRRSVFELSARISKWFKVWIAFTIMEIFLSGGVPLLWLIQGSSKTYFDFGIGSLHGLLNALLLSLSLVSFYLYKLTGAYKNLSIPIFVVFWGVVVISRNLIIVNTLQIIILNLVFSRVSIKRICSVIVLSFLIIIAFGIIGDMRSGKDEFIKLAVVSDNYPLSLPSGFLWIYMYITTPFNNLIHTIITTQPEWNYSLKNATALLLPSVIRNVFYDPTEFFKGNLISEAFNVSTAFLDVYKDIGFVGILIEATVAGFVSGFLWKKNSRYSIIAFSIISQCNILSVFFNHYFYLPIIFQFFFVWLFSKRFILKC